MVSLRRFKTDINDIYITAKTNYDRYKKRKDEYLTYEDENKAISKPEIIDDAQEILQGNKDCFIYGIPTSGKSLLLKRIGILALKENLEKPIAVFFWEFSKIASIEKFDLDNSMREQYMNHSKEKFEPNKFSKILFLFDALDELKNDSDKYAILCKILKFKLDYFLNQDEVRKEKETELNDLMEQLKASVDKKETLVLLNRIYDLDAFKRSEAIQIVISSRDQKIIQEEEILNRFEMIELLPFNVGQALKLVKKLIPNSSTKSNLFIKAIKNGLLNNNLARTPLALTLMAVLYKEDQIDLAELPANITELYNKFTDFYLERWDSKKGVSAQYKYEEARQILALIAAELQCGGKKIIHEEDLEDILNRIRAKHDFTDLNDISKFITSLKERPGLFQYNEIDKSFYFYHLTFQEYFASISFDDSNESILLDNFFSEWWENTLIFYCGKQPRREVFLRKLFKDKIPTELAQSHRYFTLLSKCMQANHLVSKELKREILHSLIHHFNKFYDQIIAKDLENEYGITYTLSTIDFIMQFREFFMNTLFSKHINIDDLKEIYQNCLSNEFATYSDVTTYCISYLLSTRENNPEYLGNFARHPMTNVRWSRIIYIDLQILKQDKKLQGKLKSKIDQKQKRNKDYIKKQFKDSAILHLADYATLLEKFKEESSKMHVP